MRKLIIHCTDEQFWNLFPLIKGACLDFSVSSTLQEETFKPHVTPFVEQARMHIEAQAIDKQLREEKAERVESQNRESDSVAKAPREYPARLNQKRDYKGRSLEQAMLEYMRNPPKPHVVFPVAELRHEAALLGWSGSVSASRAVKKLVDKGVVIALNNARFRLAGPVHGTIKSLEDLEVIK